MVQSSDTSQPAELRRLRAMMLIRRFEERTYVAYSASVRPLPDGGRLLGMGGFLHLCSGQEAVAVGVAEVFRRGVDHLAGSHRSHGHALALGVEPRRVMAELYGRAAGCCGGRAGSMALADAAAGYLGAYPIAGAQVPVGAGAAFACRYRRTGGCAFVLLGDGATNQGVVHESLNLAALLRLPVVFVVEDNGIALGTQIERHSADPDLVNRGHGYAMPSRGFNGNDVEQVVAEVGEAAARARAGEGPTFLVARTFRFRGFAMSDPMKYRTRDQMTAAQARDPIVTYAGRLRERGLLDDDDDGLRRLEADVAAVVDDAVRFAEASPDPAVGSRFDHGVGETIQPAIPTTTVR